MTCPRRTRATRRPHLRRRRWIIAIVVILIVVIASLRTFAVFYTNALWFSSVNLHAVWLQLFEVKAGLFVAFSLIFAVLLTASLLVAERLAPRGPALDAEDEFVKRYREIIGPYSRWLRVVVIAGLSLIVGSQAVGQWQNWILYRNSTPFHITDPQFHRDVSYYVFVLPFQQFLVHWSLVALVVVLIVTALSHYLNGGIRLQGPRPRVLPAVKAHISVLLGLVALVKAVGYYLARFNLDLSNNGYVQGAGYTDVHARLPALELLILVSLAAAVLLIYNIRRQGWALPILGVGLWFLVALSAGTIYPAVVQALRVNPAQNSLERPYIQRNIEATREAMGINNVQQVSYPASSNLTPTQLDANGNTLANVRLWDPTQTGQTFNRQQIRSYYQFNTLSIDRYKIDGQETPVVVGVREINDADLPATSSSWVNTTLQYTHGYGMIISPSTQVSSAGYPVYDVSNVPPESTSGAPVITQPAVYFGLNNSGYVVANTKQPEIDYQLANGKQCRDALHRRRRCSALVIVQAGDVRHPLRLAQPPHLQPDHAAVPHHVRARHSGPGLHGSPVPRPRCRSVSGPPQWPDRLGPGCVYHHRQLSLRGERRQHGGGPGERVVGHLQLRPQFGEGPRQRLHRQDDVLRPGPERPHHPDVAQGVSLDVHVGIQDEPRAARPPALSRGPLRRPGQHVWPLPHHQRQQLLQRSRRLGIVAVARVGLAQPALQTTYTTNAQGEQVSTGQLVRMAPIYQEFEAPGQSQQSFSLLDAFVPVSATSQIQTLSGFMIAGCDPGDYGQLTMYVTPRNNPAYGPSIVASQIDQTQSVSKTISLLGQQGSSVLLGNVLMVPVADSLLYIQPLYVASSRNPIPTLQYVIAVYGKNQPAGIGQTLAQALSQVFSSTIAVTPSNVTGPGQLSPEVRALLSDAQHQYLQSQVDLKAGNLGAYQADINNLESDLNEVSQLTGGTVNTTTTTTTNPLSPS